MVRFKLTLIGPTLLCLNRFNVKREVSNVPEINLPDISGCEKTLNLFGCYINCFFIILVKFISMNVKYIS